jgi:hypothetical protein
MFGENGFGDDSAQAAEANEPQNGCDQMNDEKKQMAHTQSYQCINPQTREFWTNLEFATQVDAARPAHRKGAREKRSGG